MAVDPVPAVIHGAKHSADVFRQWISGTTAGASGVSLPQDMFVKQTGTPSGQVQVAPGGIVIPNSYAGGAGQSYTGRNASATVVNVPASDSTGSKSWYIIFRIQDPQFGGPAPVDPLAGPYSFLECVSTSATVSDPHYRLAKVTVPASTAAITKAMIEDLRSVANPQKDYSIFARPRIRADDGTQMSLKGRYLNGSKTYWGELFPGGLGVPNQATFHIPEWATIMVLDARWLGIRVNGGQNSWGRYWIEYGDEGRDHGWDQGRQYEFATQQFGFDTVGTGSRYTTEWSLMDVVAVPKKLRGKDVTFAFKAGLHPDASTDGIFMDANGGLSIRADYAQQREDPDTI